MTRTLALAGMAVAVVAVVATGAFVLPAATAQEATPTPDQTEAAPDEDDGTTRGEDRRADRRERFLEFRGDLAADLAAELDVPAEDVEAAFRAVIAQRLEEAVEAGDLDRERADELLAAYDDGGLPGGLGGFGGHGFGPGGGGPGEGFREGGFRGGPGAWFGGDDA